MEKTTRIHIYDKTKKKLLKIRRIKLRQRENGSLPLIQTMDEVLTEWLTTVYYTPYKGNTVPVVRKKNKIKL